MRRIARLAGIRDVSGSYSLTQVMRNLQEKGVVLNLVYNRMRGDLPGGNRQAYIEFFHEVKAPFFGVWGHWDPPNEFKRVVPDAVRAITQVFPNANLIYCGLGSEQIHDGGKMVTIIGLNDEIDRGMDELVNSAKRELEIEKYETIGLREALNLVREPAPEGLIGRVEAAANSRISGISHRLDPFSRLATRNLVWSDNPNSKTVVKIYDKIGAAAGELIELINISKNPRLREVYALPILDKTVKFETASGEVRACLLIENVKGKVKPMPSFVPDDIAEINRLNQGLSINPYNYFHWGAYLIALTRSCKIPNGKKAPEYIPASVVESRIAWNPRRVEQFNGSAGLYSESAAYLREAQHLNSHSDFKPPNFIEGCPVKGYIPWYVIDLNETGMCDPARDAVKFFNAAYDPRGKSLQRVIRDIRRFNEMILACETYLSYGTRMDHEQLNERVMLHYVATLCQGPAAASYYGRHGPSIGEAFPKQCENHWGLFLIVREHLRKGLPL